MKFRIPTLSGGSPNAAPNATAGSPSPAMETPVPSSHTAASADDSISASVSVHEPPVAGPMSSRISEIAPDEIREIAPAVMEMPPPEPNRQIPATSSTASASLMSIFETLWDEQAHGAIVEIHLEEGIVITPEWWAKKLSNAKYGVFALENRDGSYQMEAIAWERVQRILLRNISELPSGLFE